MHKKLSLGILFACIITVFALLINFISQSVVSHGVNEIELRNAESDMNILYSILNSVTIRFKHQVFDWAVSYDTYNYIDHHNNTFITRGCTQLKIDELDLTAAAIYDIHGKRLTFIDGTMNIFGDAWLEAETRAFDRIAEKVQRDDLGAADGFLNVNGIAMLIVVHKIYDSLLEKPSNGYLIMATALDSRFRGQAQNVSGLRFSILPLQHFNKVYGVTIKNYKLVETPNTLQVYSVINDFFGKPAFCLELQKPRTIAAFGKQISQKNFLLMMTLCMLVLCAGLVIIHLAQRHNIRNEMNYRVKHDSVTGLPNDKLFHERLAYLLKQGKQNSSCLGVLYIDIDKFKSINDCYGYQQGDDILRDMTIRLKKLVKTGVIARPSADNFLVAISSRNQNAIVEQANKILDAVHKPFLTRIGSLYIGISIGIAFACNNEDSHALLQKAEHAMVDAKRRGGDTISLFEEKMQTTAVERKKLEVALRKAIENNTFTVHYQPKVNVTTREVTGCEALVRWQISDGKWVPPPVFIPIAEENNLVTNIDMFVLRSACRQALAWQNDGSGIVTISVNMSVPSILSEGFADQVLRILEEERTPPSLIHIEITESCFMSDMKTALTAISRLHNAGLRMELDDFGTGYSSLTYLSTMPISYLKIDKAFVDDIFSGKPSAQSLIKSIIALAHNIGIQTISEGVEDKSQLAFLIGNGANLIQGYLFSKPLAAEDFGEYLRHSKERIAALLGESMCVLPRAHPSS